MAPLPISNFPRYSTSSGADNIGGAEGKAESCRVNFVCFCWSVTSTEQLAEIRKVALAKVICNNADNISKIQPSVMQLPFRQVYHSPMYVVARLIWRH